MTTITVAIPTYNGEFRLPDVLEHLRSQVGISHLSVEVIVVDNNSTDRTADIVRQYQSNFPYPLRYCLETRQGAAFARKRAIREAQGRLVGFLDDDNIPSPDWIAAAWEFAETHPWAGAWGSRIYGDFETPPPAELQPLLPYLAITDRGATSKRYEPHQRILPPSAGLVVRRQAWLASVPEHTILSGRVQGSMVTGEDLEAIAHIQRTGWEVWYHPEMVIHHKIPQWRLESVYLLPFFQGVGLGRHVVRMLRFTPWQRPLATVAYALSDLYKIARHLLQHRTQVKTNLAAACYLELLINSLISPIFLYRNGYFKSPDLEQPEQPTFQSIYSKVG